MSFEMDRTRVPMLQLGSVAVEIVRLVEEFQSREYIGVAAPGSGVRRRDAMWHVPQMVKYFAMA